MEGLKTYVVLTPTGNVTIHACECNYDSERNIIRFAALRGSIREVIGIFSLDNIYGFVSEDNVIIA